jgi:hypothetical protein
MQAHVDYQSQDDYDIYFEEICQQLSLPDRSQWTADEAKHDVSYYIVGYVTNYIVKSQRDRSTLRA